MLFNDDGAPQLPTVDDYVPAGEESSCTSRPSCRPPLWTGLRNELVSIVTSEGMHVAETVVTESYGFECAMEGHSVHLIAYHS